MNGIGLSSGAIWWCRITVTCGPGLRSVCWSSTRSASSGSPACGSNRPSVSPACRGCLGHGGWLIWRGCSRRWTWRLARPMERRRAMSNDGLKDLLLPLDERNLAHVLSAVALAALASRDPEARPSESTCWWRQGGFIVRTAITDAALFGAAHRFLQRMRWIPGFGAAEQGTFAADSEIGSNPFISLAEGGQEKSPFKTFSGQQGPGDLLEGQKGSLAGATVGSSWFVHPRRR